MALTVLIANNDILLSKTYCELQEQVSINIVCWRCIGIVGGSTDLQTAVNALDTTFAALFKPLLANAATYRGMSLQRLTPNPSLAFVTAINSGIGTAGADAMSRQSCGMITKLNGIPGVRGRGRMYVPFPSSTNAGVDGQPNAGYMVNLGFLAAAFQAIQVVGAGGNFADLDACIYNRASPSSSLPWNGSTAQQKWATQKRRGDYGRANRLPF